MARGKIFTPAELKMIRECLESGLDHQDIAEFTGRTKASIDYICWRNGWNNGGFKNDVTEIDNDFNETLPSVQEEEKEAVLFKDENVSATEAENNSVVETSTVETENIVEENEPVSEKTLEAFTDEEIFQYLYDNGIRIKDGKPIRIEVVKTIVEHEIDIRSLTNE